MTTFVVLPEPDCFTISVTIDDVVTNLVVALAIDLTGIDVHFEGERVALAVLVILTLISVIALEGSILVFRFKCSNLFMSKRSGFITVTTLLAATANSANADQDTEGYDTENGTNNHTSNS